MHGGLHGQLVEFYWGRSAAPGADLSLDRGGTEVSALNRRHGPTGSGHGTQPSRYGGWVANVVVSDDDPVAPGLIQQALTAGRLVFPDGATQVFEADGGTTYVERGHPTRGEWYVDDEGRFGSLWPGDYRAGYDLRWMVEDGVIVGLRFIELRRGSRFDGRYQQ